MKYNISHIFFVVLAFFAVTSFSLLAIKWTEASSSLPKNFSVQHIVDNGKIHLAWEPHESCRISDFTSDMRWELTTQGYLPYEIDDIEEHVVSDYSGGAFSYELSEELFNSGYVAQDIEEVMQEYFEPVCFFGISKEVIFSSNNTKESEINIENTIRPTSGNSLIDNNISFGNEYSYVLLVLDENGNTVEESEPVSVSTQYTSSLSSKFQVGDRVEFCMWMPRRGYSTESGKRSSTLGRYTKGTITSLSAPYIDSYSYWPVSWDAGATSFVREDFISTTCAPFYS